MITPGAETAGGFDCDRTEAFRTGELFRRRRRSAEKALFLRRGESVLEAGKDISLSRFSDSCLRKVKARGSSGTTLRCNFVDNDVGRVRDGESMSAVAVAGTASSSDSRYWRGDWSWSSWSAGSAGGSLRRQFATREGENRSHTDRSRSEDVARARDGVRA